MSSWLGPIRLLGMAVISLGCLRVTTVPAGTCIASDAGPVAIPAHAPRRGPESARVTMVEFADFQCQYCGDVEPTVKRVLASYFNDVALVFVNLPLSMHANALRAAQAFQAAARQAKAWEMHDQMLANQKALSDADLDRYAQVIGLDLVQFDADRSSPEIADEVAQDEALAASLAVHATPTFFIEGCWMEGNQPYSAFQEVIEPELAQPARDAAVDHAAIEVGDPGYLWSWTVPAKAYLSFKDRMRSRVAGSITLLASAWSSR